MPSHIVQSIKNLNPPWSCRVLIENTFDFINMSSDFPKTWTVIDVLLMIVNRMKSVFLSLCFISAAFSSFLFPRVSILPSVCTYLYIL